MSPPRRLRALARRTRWESGDEERSRLAILIPPGTSNMHALGMYLLVNLTVHLHELKQLDTGFGRQSQSARREFQPRILDGSRRGEAQAQKAQQGCTCAGAKVQTGHEVQTRQTGCRHSGCERQPNHRAGSAGCSRPGVQRHKEVGRPADGERLATGAVYVGLNPKVACYAGTPGSHPAP
eukprot:3153910-Prymnesium_polylepis.1